MEPTITKFINIKEYSIYIYCLLVIFLQYLILPTDSYKHIDRFSHPNYQHYKTFLFDVAKFELYIGTKNCILKLNLDNFNHLPKHDFPMPPTTEKQSTCLMKGMKQEECHNFITTLLPIQSTTNYKDKQILVCGTNAYSPECEIRRLSDSFDLISKSNAFNAFSPKWNTTSLISSTGDFFYGGKLDLRGVDSSIVKQKKIFSSKPLPGMMTVRTAQYDPNWLSSDANFVFSFEYKDHIYFLFRELAFESMNVGKHIYSRIGRVCRDDPGSKNNNWQTFLKTRINCSLPGDIPFYFDEIQSVDLIDNGGTPTLYAIFNLPENSIHGSAVCAFTMDSVIEAFKGPFKHRKSTEHIWERVMDNHSVYECQMNNIVSDPRRSIRMTNFYRQMDDAVQPINGRPFIIAKNLNFKFIAVDIIKTKYHDQVEVQFIATTDGRLLKYVKWPFMEESCLVDEVSLINPQEDRFLTMKFLIDTQSLYIGTEKEIIRWTVHQCHNYITRNQCIESGDPYCGWSQTKMKCMKAPGNNLKDDNWIQSDNPTCLNRWSKWFTCSDVFSSSDITCKCRRRLCTTNVDAAERCHDGYEYEVSNCTKRNGWSEWSTWSSCTPSCGKGVQYRTRVCNILFSPGLQRSCVGSDREERLCDNLPSCTWSAWSEWTNCSDCLSTRKRTRHCLDFSGNPVNTDFCDGKYIETENCECRQKFEWSKWFITDLNHNEIVEQRTEMIMRPGNVAPKNEQRVVSLKYCDQCGGHLYNFKGKSFLIKECNCNDELIWSDWSEWSPCYNDIQTRERSCLMNVDPRSCNGHFKEIRYCQFSSAQNPRVQPVAYKMANWRLFLASFLLIILSSGLTAIVFLLYFYRKNKLNPDMMINHTISSEPNTYEEPEKCRILTTPLHCNGTSTLTRISTLKKNPSFRAKLDDSNY